MPAESKKAIAKALKLLLMPIVRLLIELGFGFRDFSEVAKLTYVDIASKNYGIKGRQTNMSRVAIMTGLTRREVARLRKVIDNRSQTFETSATVADKVLSTWHEQATFIDAAGNPKPLRIAGPGSLNELVETIRGDIPTTAIIKELTRVGTIVVNGGYARAKSRYYMPSSLGNKAIEHFGAVLHDIGTTVAHNILWHEEKEPIRYHEHVISENINPHAYEAFNQFLERRTQTLLADADVWLRQQEVGPVEAKRLRLGVGIYTICNDDGE